jgi:NitT/TauT family transport system substrate-binding protein
MMGSVTPACGLRGAGAWRWVGLALLALLAALPIPARAAAIRIGMVPAAAMGPIYIAKEKGYFGAEGIETEFVPFDASEGAAAAAASGAVDFGAAAISSALYSFTGQGPLRIISGLYSGASGFHTLAIVASDAAYDHGLREVKALAGHSVALAALGGPAHYSLGLLAEKYGADLGAMRLVPAQNPRGVLAALQGNQAEMAIIAGSIATPALQAGQVKLLGWVGDETPWQEGVTFTTTKVIAEHSSTVQAFLRALRKGAHDYHAAFTGPGGKRQDGPDAKEMLAIIAKYARQPPDQLRLGIAYVDADARLDRRDVLHQLDWFKQQNLLPGTADAATVIAQDYVIALPEQDKEGAAQK